jgi:DegV family protein with EDD domain
MPKVAVVTDSTAYIPPAMLEPYTIRVAPLFVNWGNDSYLDGVNILPGEFYERLSKAKVMPKSSQTTPAGFEKIYRDLLAQDYQIVSIQISGKLSGTVASALMAKEAVGSDAPIEVVDSYTTAMAMGFLVLEVAKAAKQGAGLKECKQLAENLRQRTGVYLTVETLEFLHRGGRIGGGARFLGQALNIKPILKLENGVIEAVERVRTRSKSISRLVELVQQEVGSQPIHLGVVNANAKADAEIMLAQAVEKLNTVESLVADVSPVIGTNAGPGTLGLTYLIA